MKLKTYILILIFVFSAFIFISSSSFNIKSDEKYTYISYLSWYNSYDEAIIMSQKEDKPIIIYFWAPWCKWCRLIEGEVFIDSEVYELLNNSFILAASNVDFEKDMTSRYGIQNSGIILFLNKDGEVLQTVGYMKPKEFLELSKHMLEIASK